MDKEKIKEFEEYFKEDLEKLEDEFKKSAKYSEQIDMEISKFSDIINSKGGQRYMIEHMRNAIQLQSQRQGILKDKLTIRKLVLDYSFRSKDEENSGKTTFDLLSQILQNQQLKKEAPIKDDKIDQKIDEALAEFHKEED